MTPYPVVQAKEKEKQGPYLLQHKRETNLSEKSDQHRGKPRASEIELFTA
jgi:hypothetical protein